MSFYSIQNKLLENYKSEVELKYKMLNGLFLSTPLDKEHNATSRLATFSNICENELAKGKDPIEIIRSLYPDISEEEKLQIFIKFIRYIERQIVLIDAIEEAAYAKTHDLNGEYSITRLTRRVERNCKENALTSALNEYKTRLVLTAHPTQFYAKLVLPIIHDLKKAIIDNDINKIRDIFLQMGKTRFSNKTKPTPEGEAISIIWYLNNIFYNIIPKVQHKLTNNNTNIEIGFWPGGDRDGNPFVTANVTKKVSKHLRSNIFNCYNKDLKRLIKKLTFEGVHEELTKIRKKLKENKYISANDFINSLKKVKNVVDDKYDSLFVDKLDSLILKVKIFGFHFTKLDIRQNAKIHNLFFNEIFKENYNLDYQTLNDAEKIKLLTKLSKEKSLVELDFSSDLAKELLETINTIQYVQQQNGYNAIERYIISNADSAASILEVLTIFRLFNKNIKNNNKKIKIEVVPLFETMEDLTNSTKIIDELLKTKLYTDNLIIWDNTQTIMLGFSDGTKDGGYFMANWSILEAKRELSRYFNSKGIKPIFFDGRGGPPSRGGGDMFLFYKGLSNVVSNHDVQVTIQGQTISAKFGNTDSAQYNLEQILTSGLYGKLNLHNAPKLTPIEVELIDELGKLSFDTYSDLKNHPEFIDYLTEITPLKYISEMKVGSRPSKRNSGEKIRLDDLRAIPYGAAWAQMRQSILAFHGLGTAINTIVNRNDDNLIALKKIYENSLIIKGIFDNALQSIEQTNFNITKHISKDVKYKDFWQQIYNEYTLAKKFLLTITGKNEKFLHANPIKERSIRMRDNITLPLVILQQYALDCLRHNSEHKHKELLETIIKKSLAANINANQNSI
ncbi:phosphoenolpyruvate carboxylase [Francisella adeliensis]|uniref:Phosphoenolpyruvate carboxylase n=1 Tax=Francisella adeliensis TaxID=2007306 RepID=A0A2Z4XYL1_9GAMM|nr:phosphoenolpyruvate carboxylase [Francisella adeliensis]AXA33523.1 phosphoenolpyruvate carboxylase [Francisella adeliensis]MBK2084776.1 phosphoenolpyruvate carboxylase [Francisella adeliensis]MBK2097281.1 phosphoenolpyruvate carboxylase [Francisella adeliensis]QIW11755.1 phosphoenolpyruvate carboxylase [Francisella adeliensis]QIW13629.1 phosphoenolpyruvate carboxylase [Francisella adeliensis]